MLLPLWPRAWACLFVSVPWGVPLFREMALGLFIFRHARDVAPSSTDPVAPLFADATMADIPEFLHLQKNDGKRQPRLHCQQSALLHLGQGPVVFTQFLQLTVIFSNKLPVSPKMPAELFLYGRWRPSPLPSAGRSRHQKHRRSQIPPSPTGAMAVPSHRPSAVSSSPPGKAQAMAQAKWAARVVCPRMFLQKKEGYRPGSRPAFFPRL